VHVSIFKSINAASADVKAAPLTVQKSRVAWEFLGTTVALEQIDFIVNGFVASSKFALVKSHLNGQAVVGAVRTNVEVAVGASEHTSEALLGLSTVVTHEVSMATSLLIHVLECLGQLVAVWAVPEVV